MLIDTIAGFDRMSSLIPKNEWFFKGFGRNISPFAEGRSDMLSIWREAALRVCKGDSCLRMLFRVRRQNRLELDFF